MDNLERDIYIERQDPDVANAETPQQTRARLIKMYQNQPQAPQGYDSGQIPFSAPNPQAQPIQNLTQLMQQGTRPRISQPNYLEQLLQRIRQ